MTVALCPIPKMQFFGNDGLPLAGGHFYTYEPGLPGVYKATYTNSTGLVQNTNPVILDAYGRAPIWLNGLYLVELWTGDRNLPGSTKLWDMDNIGEVYATAMVSSQWVEWGTAPTYISATQFSVTGSYAASFPAGLRVKAAVTAGTIYGTVSTASAGGVPVVTTVTVIWDNVQLDSGLSSVSLGILSATNGAVPIRPLQTKTGAYSLASSDAGSIILFNGTADGAFLLHGPALSPSGGVYRIKNVTTGYVLTITGTVNGTTNPVLNPGEDTTIYSDGTNWKSDNWYGIAPSSPVIEKTDNYVIKAFEVNRLFLANKVSAVALTLPNPATVRSGSWITFRNVGAGLLTVTGTVSANVNPDVRTGDEITVVSDGVSWHGRLMNTSVITVYGPSDISLAAPNTPVTWTQVHKKFCKTSKLVIVVEGDMTGTVNNSNFTSTVLVTVDGSQLGKSRVFTLGTSAFGTLASGIEMTRVASVDSGDRTIVLSCATDTGGGVFKNITVTVMEIL